MKQLMEHRRSGPNEQSEVVCVLSEYAAAFVTLVDLLGMQLIKKKREYTHNLIMH